MNRACKICHITEDNRLHYAREMTFGLRDQFTYLECGRCGCLQILEIPKDMAKYYGQGYVLAPKCLMSLPIRSIMTPGKRKPFERNISKTNPTLCFHSDRKSVV